MTSRSFSDYIIDLATAVNEIEEFTANMSFHDFTHDKKTINAVIRSLEVLGEAAGKIPDDIKCRYNEIPWKYMITMRNKLIHEYFGVDIEIVWIVIKEELPTLKSAIQKLKENET